MDELPEAATQEYRERMRSELHRGVLVLAVLAALKTDEYGYSLRRKLLEANVDIDEGTLYPLIRRLESHGLLDSEWREVENRKRRYYRISAAGTAVLNELSQDWRRMAGSLDNLLENKT
jgi:PadR family transcriptional regulator, regulatory protein PadR